MNFGMLYNRYQSISLNWSLHVVLPAAAECIYWAIIARVEMLHSDWTATPVAACTKTVRVLAPDLPPIRDGWATPNYADTTPNALLIRL